MSPVKRPRLVTKAQTSRASRNVRKARIANSGKPREHYQFLVERRTKLPDPRGRIKWDLKQGQQYGGGFQNFIGPRIAGEPKNIQAIQVLPNREHRTIGAKEWKDFEIKSGTALNLLAERVAGELLRTRKEDSIGFYRRGNTYFVLVSNRLANVQGRSTGTKGMQYFRVVNPALIEALDYLTGSMEKLTGSGKRKR